MNIKCNYCGVAFSRKPSAIKEKNYCSMECYSSAKTVTRPCEICGKKVTRCQSQMREHVFCSADCSRIFTSERMTRMNIELNPQRMTSEVRFKLREFRLGTGEGKSYPKFFGVHEHRIVAEIKIGRKLEKGEVVHHKDRNKRNNCPTNLRVFKNQAEHAAWHAKHDKNVG